MNKNENVTSKGRSERYDFLLALLLRGMPAAMFEDMHATCGEVHVVRN